MAQTIVRSLVLESAMKESFREDREKISKPLQKANEVLKDATFKTFDSDSISTTHIKLSLESYYDIVDSLVESYGFTKGHRAQIKNLSKAEANKTNILKVYRAREDGSVIYGIFAVLNRGGEIDMVYAVYTAKYEFEPTVKITREPTKLFGVRWDYTETKEYQYPRISAAESFIEAFFENKAIEALEQKY